MSELKTVTEAVNKIAEAVEEQRSVNEKRIDELAKGNEARARELDEKWNKLEEEIVRAQKEKRQLEKRLETQQERVELLEAANDRPRGTIQDKIRSEHKDAFMAWMRAGGKDSEAEAKMRSLKEKAREFKDVVIGTAASGGFAVPEEISSMVDALLLKQSDVLNRVKTVQTGTSDYKELISIHGGNSGWTGETGSRTATGTANLREVAPTWGELYAYPQASEWSLQDIFFDVQGWLVDDITDGMRKNLDSAIWSGNGSTKPTGLTNTAPVATADHASPLRNKAAFEYVPMSSPSSPLALTADHVIDLVYKLNRAYRPNASFGMNTVTQGAVRKLKSTNGDYYWQPSLQAGQPDRLLGYEVFTFEDMDDATTDNGLPIGFGDWRRAYTLAYRRELAITVDNVTNPGYVRFYVRRRYGGIVANNDCLKFLKVAES